jgi:adenylate cyclase
MGFIRSPLTKAILLGLFIGVVGLVVSPLRFTLGIEENIGLGLLFKLRGAREAPADTVVVSIDRESSEELNLPDNPDKWPRSLHARLTENLLAEGAKVVAFDVHFLEPRDAGDDQFFARAMKKASNVILCEPVKEKEIPVPQGDNAGEARHSIVRVVQPIDLFSQSARATAPFTLPRIPFKVNHFWAFEKGAGDSPTMPIVALQLFARNTYKEFIRLLETARPDLTGALPAEAERALKSGNVKAFMKDVREIFVSDPLIAERMTEEIERSEVISRDHNKQRLIAALINLYDGTNSRYINFYGPPGTVTTIPYHQALNLRDGKVGTKTIDLTGKAVFVGLSEVLLAERKDSFYTVFSQANGTFIGGVEIMATAFSNLLTNTAVKPIGLLSFVFILFFWGIFLGIICRRLRVWVAAGAVIGSVMLYMLLSVYLFKTHHTWLPLVVPMFVQAPLAFFGAVLWNYFDVSRERENIKSAFEHYLPKDVVDQLSQDIAHIQTGSRTVYGVCLFTDAQQYSSLSETMDPHELGKFMSRYYETMFQPVKKNAGFVSGVMGDSMLALWVAARSEAALRSNACAAALDIDRALKDFKQKASDAVKIKTRIGLHYGQIFLGHVGALDHYEYTPMGDIVNAASRLEGLNKYLGTTVLISGDVAHELDGFLTRELGNFRLKGKGKPIAVYELLCRREEADEKQRSACTLFKEAMTAYNAQSWTEAEERFRLANEMLGGDDGPSLFYLGLCEHYVQNPVEGAWDGVVHMDAK